MNIQYPSSTDLLFDLDWKNKSIFIRHLIVPEDQRRLGIGSSILNQISNHADKHNLLTFLIPSDSFGSNLPRLIRFYQQFGFLPITDAPQIIQKHFSFLRLDYYVRLYQQISDFPYQPPEKNFSETFQRISGFPSRDW
jgi:GNAT superfamily N-acetyltransferase